MVSVEVLRPAQYGPSIDLPAPYPKNTTFPLSLKVSRVEFSIDDIVTEIHNLTASGRIRSLLDQHGAIYFQDLALENPLEFSKFAHAFGYVPHEDIGNPVRRTVLAPNVATANEGPNTMPVYPHNEFGLSPHYPAYVFFYCVSPPETGGETPINNSVGVKYQLFHPNGPRDQTSSAGTTVLQAYGQHVLDSDDTKTARAKIETEIRRLPTATWEWLNQSEANPLGDLRVWQVLPAIRNHPRTGQPAFFNNVVSRFLNALRNGTLLPPHVSSEGEYLPPCFYGDGSLIPREYLDSAVEFIGQTRALVTWKRGDVILIDNHAVQHAREPWTGERKLLASLWDEPETEST
ncbi:Clavaminate synthase-like protein [Parathielavia appendiculata]|uniref:Clavaminate synthase-like protein n=1 Tax=Parathielavia appendiculata TaxID=2587402 RepID=A0AAN6U2B4_9PEZI|nr:Clavaminate synthase-like protein [Parathielavia appendiculata]